MTCSNNGPYTEGGVFNDSQFMSASILNSTLTAATLTGGVTLDTATVTALVDQICPELDSCILTHLNGATVDGVTISNGTITGSNIDAETGQAIYDALSDKISTLVSLLIANKLATDLGDITTGDITADDVTADTVNAKALELTSSGVTELVDSIWSALETKLIPWTNAKLVELTGTTINNGTLNNPTLTGAIGISTETADAFKRSLGIDTDITDALANISGSTITNSTLQSPTINGALGLDEEATGSIVAAINTSLQDLFDTMFDCRETGTSADAVAAVFKDCDGTALVPDTYIATCVNLTALESSLVGRIDGVVSDFDNISISAGDGLSGGGSLSDNRIIALGTPGSITETSTNSVTQTSHTHQIDKATTSAAGIVELATQDEVNTGTPDKVVTADKNKVYVDNEISEVNTNITELATQAQLSSDDGNLLQQRDNGIYYGIEAEANVSHLYVDSMDGDDENIGSRSSPLKTLDKALSLSPLNNSNTISLRCGGEYYLTRSHGVNQGATRNINAYDDPYIDGDKYSELTQSTTVPRYYIREAINRPKLYTTCYYSILNTGNIYLYTYGFIATGASMSFTAIDIYTYPYNTYSSPYYKTLTNIKDLTLEEYNEANYFVKRLFAGYGSSNFLFSGCRFIYDLTWKTDEMEKEDEFATIFQASSYDRLPAITFYSCELSDGLEPVGKDIGNIIVSQSAFGELSLKNITDGYKDGAGEDFEKINFNMGDYLSSNYISGVVKNSKGDVLNIRTNFEFD